MRGGGRGVWSSLGEVNAMAKYLIGLSSTCAESSTEECTRPTQKDKHASTTWTGRASFTSASILRLSMLGRSERLQCWWWNRWRQPEGGSVIWSVSLKWAWPIHRQEGTHSAACLPSTESRLGWYHQLYHRRTWWGVVMMVVVKSFVEITPNPKLRRNLRV